MTLFNIVSEYIEKEKFANSELKQLERDFTSFANNGKLTDLLVRFRNIQYLILEDDRIKNLNLLSNEVFKQSAVVCNANAIISDIIECFVFNVERSSFAIAVDVVQKNIKLINDGNFEAELINGFLPLSVSYEYENIISKSGKHFLWNSNPELRIQLLMSAHMNVSFDSYLDKETKFEKLVKSSNRIGKFFGLFCAIPLNILSIFFVMQELIRVRMIVFDLPFFAELSNYKHDKLFQKHFSKYFWSMVTSAILINPYLIYKIVRLFI